MTKMQTLPIEANESNMSRYLQQMRTFPMLDAEQEYMLARRWREHGDIKAAHQLVTSHLRLVAKIAVSYRGYGLPISDLISEGNVGMMQAVTRFEPDRGFRLSTYAVWWIRAAIQEYILHSWSLVKMGTTPAQKKLFFNLRKLKRELQAIDEGDLSPENVQKIATDLNVSEQDVINMNRRLAAPDRSLNAPLTIDGDGEWQDWLVDETDSQEIMLAKHQELSKRHRLLSHAMKSLNGREHRILAERRLKDEPTTLEALSKEYGVTRERVRQIEVRAFEKLQRAIKGRAIDRSNRHDGSAVETVRSIERKARCTVAPKWRA
jgi:RNA polymerase sigma-32 factor